MVECQLPKLVTRVRFPSLAHVREKIGVKGSCRDGV